MAKPAKAKAKRVVVVSLTAAPGGLRISLDDAVRQPGSEKTWLQVEHVTNKVYPKSKIKKLDFSDEELANLGHYVLARLYAFMEMGEI